MMGTTRSTRAGVRQHAASTPARPSVRAARTPIAALLAGLLLFAAFLLGAPAASAHDQLVGSDPAANATLDTAPDSVTLTYSADLTRIGNVVTVTDSHGTTVSQGETAVDGTHVTQKITPGAGDETYTVNWRVVSSDGHPIEGSYAFTVGQGGSGEQTATPSAAAHEHDHEHEEGHEHATTSAAAAPETTASTSPAAAATAQNDSDGLPLWAVALIGAVGAVVVIGIIALVVLGIRQSRRRSAAERSEATQSASGAPSDEQRK